MEKLLKLTYDEYWILVYGSTWLDKFFNSTIDYTFNPTAEIKINIEKAVEAENEAYKRLLENHNLLSCFGYRERRLNIEAHNSLKNKLQN